VTVIRAIGMMDKLGKSSAGCVDGVGDGGYVHSGLVGGHVSPGTRASKHPS
jgi:hypothetical protein